MKISTINVFIATLLFNIAFAKAQDRTIFLSGNVDTGLVKEYACNDLTIRINETTNRQSMGSIINTPISASGNFKISIQLPNSTSYLSFEMIDNTHEKRFVNVNFKGTKSLKEVYLFEKGDSINIDINKGGNLTFRGKGSSKLNCQWQIYNIDLSQKGSNYRLTELENLGEYEKKLFLNDRLIVLATQMRLEILNSYKDLISEKIYHLLHLDILALGEYEKRSFLYFMCIKSSPLASELGKKAAQKYYNYTLHKNADNYIASNHMAESAFYAEMLFQKEFVYFQLYCKNGYYYRGDSFNEIYEQLKKKYSGKLRDKLIYICFERLNRVYSEAARSKVDDALKIVQEQKYNLLLKKYSKKQYTAYPFELQDERGKIHKLGDYKGKVLIIDFWYTGCIWCRSLNKAMGPIVQKYGTNKNVVFFTISIDKERNRWLKSVASGQYTSPGTINLYTNGLGESHPFIKNYNITAYPRQLIIGKSGELITSSPPRVDLTPAGRIINETSDKKSSVGNRDEFIGLIDSALK